jgi:hypothetical protein
LFFSVFVLANICFSYLPFPLEVKGFIFFLGLILFLLIAWKTGNFLKPRDSLRFQEKGPGYISKNFFLFFAVAAVLFRFCLLKLFHPWPSGDEALQGFFAIDLIENWNWRFFYTTGQHPPLLIWCLKWFFQSFQSPFFDLWFLPSFVSVLFTFLGYWASRIYFSEKISTVYFSLLALSFWPLYFGGFCVQGALVPLFEMAALILMGYFLKSKKGATKYFFAILLGLWVGVGTWVYTSWFSVVFFLVFLLFFVAFEKRPRGFQYLLVFLFSLSLGALPWIVAVFHEGFGGYVLGVSFLSGYFNLWDQLLTSASYLTSLFWGTLKEPVSYGPVWGGVLNPIFGACFFTGATELFRLRKNPLTAVLAAGFFLFLLPGILSADHVEMFRIIQVMPVLLLLVAIGIIRLLDDLPRRRRLTAFVLILVFSLPLDLYHLLKTSSASFNPLNPVFEVKDENYWAYQKFQAQFEKSGPGLIYTDFILLDHDHTLNVMSYHFNALVNPKYRFEEARWAGVVTNVHYVPFLARRFPGSQWYPITPYAVEDGGSAAGIIPVMPGNLEVLLKWSIAHRYFHRLNIQAENIMNNRAQYIVAVQKLPEGYPLVSGDPFLESCFGEWMGQYHFGPDFGPNIQAIRRALLKGYSTANLYYKLGNFYLLNRQRTEAKKAYLMAARSHPNYTNVKDAIAYLEKLH